MRLGQRAPPGFRPAGQLARLHPPRQPPRPGLTPRTRTQVASSVGKHGGCQWGAVGVSDGPCHLQHGTGCVGIDGAVVCGAGTGGWRGGRPLSGGGGGGRPAGTGSSWHPVLAPRKPPQTPGHTGGSRESRTNWGGRSGAGSGPVSEGHTHVGSAGLQAHLYHGGAAAAGRGRGADACERRSNAAPGPAQRWVRSSSVGAGAAAQAAAQGARAGWQQAGWAWSAPHRTFCELRCYQKTCEQQQRGPDRKWAKPPAHGPPLRYNALLHVADLRSAPHFQQSWQPRRRPGQVCALRGRSTEVARVQVGDRRPNWVPGAHPCAAGGDRRCVRASATHARPCKAGAAQFERSTALCRPQKQAAHLQDQSSGRTPPPLRAGQSPVKRRCAPHAVEPARTRPLACPL